MIALAVGVAAGLLTGGIILGVAEILHRLERRTFR